MHSESRLAVLMIAFVLIGAGLAILFFGDRRH
jgi:hypothetical protein